MRNRIKTKSKKKKNHTDKTFVLFLHVIIPPLSISTRLHNWAEHTAAADTNVVWLCGAAVCLPLPALLCPSVRCRCRLGTHPTNEQTKPKQFTTKLCRRRKTVRLSRDATTACYFFFFFLLCVRVRFFDLIRSVIILIIIVIVVCFHSALCCLELSVCCSRVFCCCLKYENPKKRRKIQQEIVI